MKIAFLHSDKPRERILADAVLMGAARHGFETTGVSLSNTPQPGQFDVVCMVGVKSRELFRAHHRVGARVLYLDKGYCRGKRGGPVRGWEYWRIALDSHQPTNRLMARDYSERRWRRLGIRPEPWREAGDHVLIAGSSAKYHAFHELDEPTAYTAALIGDLQRKTNRPLVYRPKPSWLGAVPIDGARFSPPSESIGDVLDNAWAVVTHGSNACFEALVAGIPCVVLGDAVARPISSTSIEDIEEPRLAAEAQRSKLFHALAWWQWRAAEFASGEAWEFIRSEIHA